MATLAARRTDSGQRAIRPAAPEAPDGRAKRSKPCRVLIVEDEPLIRWSCAETLSASGFPVIEVDCGDAALSVLSQPSGGADVILLDLILPDSRDLFLLRRLRRLVPAVPILMMTAFATRETVEEARRLGAVGVIEKPFDLNDLVPLVRQALASDVTAEA
jgi:DNA-binding NtrC family response regulator